MKSRDIIPNKKTSFSGDHGDLKNMKRTSARDRILVKMVSFYKCNDWQFLSYAINIHNRRQIRTEAKQRFKSEAKHRNNSQ